MPNWAFRVVERFLVRKDWDKVYQPGDRRTVVTMLPAETEEEARRKIIGRAGQDGLVVESITLEHVSD